MNKSISHLDEGRSNSITLLTRMIEEEPDIERAVLIEDIFGMFRVVLWCVKDCRADLQTRIDAEFFQAAGPFWSREIWIGPGKAKADQMIFDRAWNEGYELAPKLRFNERHRAKGGWIHAPIDPPWPIAEGEEQSPPIVSFYSFKGGIGRTTALAGFAIQQARAGQRVVVVDLDLDAPGVGALLNPGEGVPGARWGAVDYILEQPVLKKVDLRDYYHVYAREDVTGAGEILVVPAGQIDENYLGKIARIDLEPPPTGEEHPLQHLLRQIREEAKPQWILLDLRAGLSEVAGFALGGLAHLNILFGTTSEQSWQGLDLVIDRIGADRVRRNQMQGECLIVQGMTPANPATAKLSEEQFEIRIREEFTQRYYSRDPADPEEDRFWYIRDMESQDAPHVPIHIRYSESLAFFTSLEDVADVLIQSDDYKKLFQRILSRFAKEEP
jgi:cellulose biosynthesis protein BcsQ